MARRRVALAMLAHRTNVFCPVGTSLADFRSRRLAFGPEVSERYDGTRTALGGILAAARRHDWDLLPILAAWGPPGGVCAADAYDYFRRIIVLGVAAGCSSAEGLDGVIVVLPGAMVVQGTPDPAADLALAVRGIVGRRRPIVAVVDFLSNLSAELVQATDACLTGRTNPSVDDAECGADAAELLQGMLDSGARPVQRLAQAPLLAPPVALRSVQPPMADLLELCRVWERRPGVMRVGVCGGFPFADVPEAGLAVVALAASDAELAHQAATEVAELAFASRRAFRHTLEPPAAVLPQILASPEGDPRPVALLDPADDPAAGAAGDTIHLLRALAGAEPRSALAAVLWDPQAVALAVRVGVAAQVAFDLGGHLDPGGPLRIAGRVRAMGDGQFTSERADLRGLPQDAGRTALLDLGPRGGLRLIVTERRIEAADPGLLRHLGVDPADNAAMLVKGWVPLNPDWQAWRACVELDAPGLSHPDLTRLPFKRVRRPIYPLDPI